MCFCLSQNLGLRIKARTLLTQLPIVLEQAVSSLRLRGAPVDYPFSSKNVLNLGFISSPELMASLYRNAQCTLILSKVESFSMPTAESLCCGTPVVGFKAGGPESFANRCFSSFVDQNDLEGLALQILRFSSNKPAKQSASNFEPEIIASQYLQVYQVTLLFPLGKSLLMLQYPNKRHMQNLKNRKFIRTLGPDSRGYFGYQRRLSCFQPMQPSTIFQWCLLADFLLWLHLGLSTIGVYALFGVYRMQTDNFGLFESIKLMALTAGWSLTLYIVMLLLQFTPAFHDFPYLNWKSFVLGAIVEAFLVVVLRFVKRVWLAIRARRKNKENSYSNLGHWCRWCRQNCY
jgi:hypothetical protein